MLACEVQTIQICPEVIIEVCAKSNCGMAWHTVTKQLSELLGQPKLLICSNKKLHFPNMVLVHLRFRNFQLPQHSDLHHQKTKTGLILFDKAYSCVTTSQNCQTGLSHRRHNIYFFEKYVYWTEWFLSHAYIFSYSPKKKKKNSQLTQL